MRDCGRLGDLNDFSKKVTVHQSRTLDARYDALHIEAFQGECRDAGKTHLELFEWLPGSLGALMNALTTYVTLASYSAAAWCSSAGGRNGVSVDTARASQLTLDPDLVAALLKVHSNVGAVCQKPGPNFGAAPCVWELVDAAIVQIGALQQSSFPSVQVQDFLTLWCKQSDSTGIILVPGFMTVQSDRWAS